MSPRRRKLRITLLILLSVCIAGSATGMAVYWKSRPQQYEPGEHDEDLTSELSRNLPANAPRPKFSDVTATSGLATFRNFAGARTSQLPEDMGPGLAWGDFDNDGDEDLFLVSAGGSLKLEAGELFPSRLYENLGNGRFAESRAFPDLKVRGMSAAWGDFDGDGWLDLAVSAFDSLHLFRNTGGSVPTLVAVTNFPSPRGFWAGVSWGDYDNDRDLDLYVCNYVKYVPNDEDFSRQSDQLGTFVPYTLNPASYEAGENLLLRNNGDGTFTDVAGELGVTNPTGRSLCALWHDFDDDGWLDLYVANDVSDNVFYRNSGGRFEDISHPAWVADQRSAMGIAVGDYNRDGDDDLFITHWVGQENALYENHWADFKDARKLRFTDVNEMRGLGQVALPFVGWGAEFADFDNDGWLDIVVANGSTLEDRQSRQLKRQEPFLFWNHGGEFFHDLAPLSKALSARHVSRGLALADYDNDGDLDIAIAQLGEGVQLIRNDMASGQWLKLRLRSQNARGELTGSGEGAKVIVHAGDQALRRSVSTVSYLSQSTRTIHVGLGSESTIDRVEVRWLGGGTNFFEGILGNRFYELAEGKSVPQPIEFSPRDERTVLVEFWKTQRAAMDTLKIQNDPAKAIPLFRQALALNPKHEDSYYYLAQCLAAQGEIDSALDQLAALKRLNSQSHRAFQQWGNLRALFAKSAEHLAEAEGSLEQARAINPEETGALLILGELSILRGNPDQAESRLAAVCATNPRAAGGFFLRGYLAFKRGDREAAVKHLHSTRGALGPEWQPRGTTAEGDTLQQQHVESSPLRQFWENWDGSESPEAAFAPLDNHLAAGPGRT